MKFSTSLTALTTLAALSSCSSNPPKPAHADKAPPPPVAAAPRAPQDLATNETTPGQKSIGDVETNTGEVQVTRPIPTITKKSVRADINRMSTTDFINLGLAPEVAQKVVEYRKDHGSFGSVNELRLVPGMDETWMGKTQSQLGVS